MPPSKLLAIYTKFSAYGGVSRMMVNLANAAAEHGIQVDILPAAGEVPQHSFSPAVNVLPFKNRHVYSALPGLISYLKAKKPQALLAVRHRAINSAILAHLLSGQRDKTLLALRLSGNISSSVHHKNFLARSMHYLPIKALYPKADLIISVSQGVADDLVSSTRIADQNIKVLPNPSIPDYIQEWAARDPEHPWLQNKQKPVILAVGRFTKRKDFATLIRAFSLLLEGQQARLILIGHGAEYSHLQNLTKELGIEQYVDFPGYQENPYAYMSRSDLLVLSSTGAEGSPNVLKEAMALGLPVVSTDCPSGPREILEHGKLGSLIPVQDPKAMAEAMLQTLRHPPQPETLRQAAQKYSVRSAARTYLRELGLLT
ncbi:MAG: glycosyltransferase [Desulfohalobiaceae bacterium]